MGKALITVPKYKGDKTCAITYTFDDGLKEHFTLAAPELEKRGFKGTFWISGAYIDKNRIQNNVYISWPDLKEMADKGHEISNHTWSHQDLTQISLEEVKAEVVKNDNVILNNIGIMPRTFCFPYNARNLDIYEVVSEGRIAIRSREYGLGSKSTPTELKKWILQLLQRKEWGIGMIHGITYGYDAFQYSSILWEHFDFVKSLENKIWIGTFSEVAAYIKERDNLEGEIIDEGDYLTITPKLSLDQNIYTQLLTMVIEKQGIKKVVVEQDQKSLNIEIILNKVLFDFNPYGGPIRVNFN